MTVSGEHMLKDMLMVKVALKELKIRVQMGAEYFPVFILTKVCVCISKPMRTKGLLIDTFVLNASTNKVNFLTTPRWSAGGSKAMQRTMLKKRISLDAYPGY